MYNSTKKQYFFSAKSILDLNRPATAKIYEIYVLIQLSHRKVYYNFLQLLELHQLLA